MFEVRIGSRAQKGIKRLDPKMLKLVLECLKVLEENPVPAKNYNVKKVEGVDFIYRIRIQYMRIKYGVLWNEKTIEIYKIERKKDRTYKQQ